jgi:hypothetical protein
MLRGFMQRAGLRRWLSRSKSPQLIQEVHALLDHSYGIDDDLHNRELAQADAERATSRFEIAPLELRPLLRANSVRLRARLRVDGIVYARASTHVGNSLVMYYANSDRTVKPVPGLIEYIYDDGSSTRFAVRRYIEASLHGPDPFAQWADFPARMYSTDLGSLEAVDVEFVVSHFAQYVFDDELQVVLDLNPVSFYLIS